MPEQTMRDHYKEKAAEWLGIPYEQVTDKQRNWAKTRLWPLGYVSVGKPLRELLGMDEQEEAAQLLKECDFAALELRMMAWENHEDR